MTRAPDTDLLPVVTAKSGTEGEPGICGKKVGAWCDPSTDHKQLRSF